MSTAVPQVVRQQQEGEADEREGELTVKAVGLGPMIAPVAGEEELVVGQAADAADKVLDIGRRSAERAGELARAGATGGGDEGKRASEERGLLGDVEVTVREHVSGDVGDTAKERGLGAGACEAAEGGADECVEGDDHGGRRGVEESDSDFRLFGFPLFGLSGASVRA